MKEEDPDLKFQRYSHDKILGGTAPGEDGGPVDRKHTTQLTPRVYNDLMTDKTVGWQLEEALRGLEELLK